MARRKIRSDAESEAESEVEEEVSYVSSSSNKRIRLENGEPSTSAPIELDEDTTMNGNTPEPLLVGDDGFVEGSIVKIILTNFVTYDYCEIYPGPQMNMIIGPNGTGKSTIVCAIALGLGGAPALLGRAKNIAEFVKTGEDEANILIELKHVNQRNVVIQRFLKRQNNATSWRVNGKPSTQKDVMSIVSKFNIQVDNLCQFLPQDRVAEFAELSPSQLLERTQSATGKSDLHDMQKQLIEWRDQEKALINTNESDIDHLKTLNNKNAELEKDVLRLEKKQRIEREISLLKTQLPLVKYTECKARTDQFLANYNVEKENVAAAKANVRPIENAVSEVEKAKIEANRVKINHDKNYSQAVATIKTYSKDIGVLREDIDTRKKEIKNYEAKIPQRQREIEDVERTIAHYEEQLQNPPDSDYSRFEEAINEVNREMHELQSNSSDINQKIREGTKTLHEAKSNFAKKREELKELQNVANQRYMKLKRNSPDTIKALEWYKANKAEFKGRVYPPVILNLELKDKKYAAFVENALGGSKSKLLRTFIFEEKEDYMKFAHYTADRMKWDVSCEWPGHISDDVLETPVSNEVLKARYDMDFFISEVIVAPRYVLKTLCLEKYINKYPVALQCSREADIVNAGIFGKFAIGRTLYNVKISPYGKRSKQTTTTTLRGAEFLSDSVDRELEGSLKEQISSLEADMQHHEATLQAYHTEINQLKQSLSELRHKKENLTEQKRDIQRQVQLFSKKKAKLQQLKVDLVELRKRPEKDREAINRLKEEIRELTNREDIALERYVTALGRITEAYESRLIVSMQYFYLQEKFGAMRNYAKSHSSELQEAQRRMDSALREYKIAERETKKYMDECKQAGNGLPNELVDDFKAIVNQWKEGNLTTTLAELEQKIAEKEGELASIRYANPSAMNHYHERKLEIQRLEGKIAENQAKLQHLRAKITELRDRWAPVVKQLVADINVKFSAAFSRINCVGEVQVEENEDFDKWGINIYVKFRNTEKLQLLTGQRQSGGERSVSTILYLMSLQDLAKSPFRVVDEINQGMDPRNERMIHEQIVQGASRPGTSQYFLITPKLLPDLFYNERIRILCIYNSEWLPRKIKPLSDYLENHRQSQNV